MRSTVCERETLVDGQEIFQKFLTCGSFVSTDSGELWIGIGAPRPSGTSDSDALSVFAPTFFLTDPQPWLLYSHFECVRAEDLLARLDAVAVPPLVAAGWETSSSAAHAAAIADIQARIETGELVKAVPFVSLTGKMEFSTPVRAWLLANAIRHAASQADRHPVGTVYGIWDADSGMIGLTPEILFTEDARRSDLPVLLTMALAGTRRPGGLPLTEDAKEMMEHRIVVEGIAEQLSPLGQVQIGPVHEQEVPDLVHLCTPIEVWPHRRVEFGQWVAALHPTPAIGAWPREAGNRWLRAQPNADLRGRYGAPFGVIPPGSHVGTCLVAIRNLQWAGTSARILAGGGIVAASEPRREWREANAKLNAVLNSLGFSPIAVSESGE